ncbi:DUF4131 domain-containing protein, partial [Pseudomonadota bacterium]
MPTLWWAIVIIPAILCSLRWRYLFPIFVFLTGFFWSLFQADTILNNKLPLALEGRDLTVTGIVSTLPRYRANSVQFNFLSDKIESPHFILTDTHKLRLSWY